MRLDDDNVKSKKPVRVEALDKVNDKRVETTKKRVAHALLLLNDSKSCADNEIDRAIKLAAKAMSLLTTASDEMTYACEHYEWDLEVVDLINEGISKIAHAIAPIIYHPEEADIEYGYRMDINEAHDVLAKAFGYLLVWYDDDIRIEDV